ncbi:ABSCISIC ACID-INSENSITIVE 5-like protein 1 [Brachypodium distachyon]|uniref:BZIP domain-containing protein n=1 Tax=Brachypodium distachyon TaxID=15368 RepID=I1HTK7_BRADI|nr:ABSCISIC ACID-INSENSITIVE 5-like protein 1 [Brachypodium distachyon]KQK10685.1 hypothetical protein BRADI_2g55550v3 [Brachypodium distachyon]|eukprot:XP_003567284.1 ABSCISIC ACID-INSENSITIVE 5-like protein 1 [Brachypodium distachyon]
MASEMSKNLMASDDQEVTSQQRDQLSGGAAAAAEGQGEQQVVAPLERQPSSILERTLEELSYSLYDGRGLGSINMDEFVANIWNTEEFQAATGGLMADMENQAAVVGAAGGSGGAGAGGSGTLCRQGSFSLPPPLSRKTVDEVWAEINDEGPLAHAQVPAFLPQAPPQPLAVQPPMGNGGGVAANGRQVTLGSMTLEDFLVKAGVVRGGIAGQGQPPMPAGQLAHGPMSGMQQGQVQPVGPMMYPMAPANAMYQMMGDGMGFQANGYADMAILPPPPPPSQGGVCILSPGSSDGISAMTNCFGSGSQAMMMMDNGARKRSAPEDRSGGMSMERRHRRMIKNRESAARSRARRQAYTVELEAELDKLKEENARLKAQEGSILMAKQQKMENEMMEKSKENASAKKGGLRRSSSCTW